MVRHSRRRPCVFAGRLSNGSGDTDGSPDGDPDPRGRRRGDWVRFDSVVVGVEGEAVAAGAGAAGGEQEQERLLGLPHGGRGGAQ